MHESIATEQLILTWTTLPLSSPLEMIIESDILVLIVDVFENCVLHCALYICTKENFIIKQMQTELGKEF